MTCTLKAHIAVDGDNLLISTWKDQEDHRDEKEDGPCYYQVIKIGTRETDNPVDENTLVIKCGL